MVLIKEVRSSRRRYERSASAASSGPWATSPALHHTALFDGRGSLLSHNSFKQGHTLDAMYRRKGRERGDHLPGIEVQRCQLAEVGIGHVHIEGL